MAEQEVASGKVATVISDRQIAINVGTGAGVRAGDEVVLYRKVKIVDPDSSEELGTVRLVKLRLDIEKVFEKYALARVVSRYATTSENGQINWSFLGGNTKRITSNSHMSTDRVVHVEVGEIAQVMRDETQN